VFSSNYLTIYFYLVLEKFVTETFNKLSELSEPMIQLIGILASTLGFLGVQCLALLLISFVLLFFMGLSNPIFPKFNYSFVVICSVVLGWITGMSFLAVIKYICIMAFPLIISIFLPILTNLIWKNWEKLKTNKTISDGASSKADGASH
jgi:hypothetical protein